ncbi:hypothetical protein JCM3765_000067 [Sporobolomyces pararoseus]
MDRKRPRSLSATSSSTDILLRNQNSSTGDYICSLPPTCSNQPFKSFSTLSSYQQHYKTFHTFICQSKPSTYSFAQSKSKSKQKEEEQCGRIFPNEKLLILHFKECHDPITQELQLRGDKTFECLDSECIQKFSNPKNRRVHMIEKHGYPKEWFFSVVIWGINNLISNDSSDNGKVFHGMVRKEWKPRVDNQVEEEKKKDKEEKEEEEEMLMEGLVKSFSKTSIEFVPRSVPTKQKKKNQNKCKMSIESSSVT